MSTIYRTVEGDVLDIIVWRHYGDKPGALEQVLEANSALRHQPALLAKNTLVTLPEIITPVTAQTVRLWS